MKKQRIIETNEGIQDKITVEIFDNFARIMRDKGWNNVNSFIKAGITKGNVLEIGPGPGYVGLEWLKKFPDAALTGCEISWEMIRLAEKNARDYGFEKRTVYVEGNCMEMPFPDSSFDAVISNGSLHEWEDPVKVFNEINRVLKPQGLLCITDMRRDVNSLIKWFIYFSTRPKEIRPGFLTSFNASYTIDEIKNLLGQSKLKNTAVSMEFFGLCITGKKTAL
ncbi:class I SAM-dependent methyltransferase [Lacrimispora sp.]|uniref:class I SAM-dependent methyltransferase n=1 Tax=Lacrimispora sp. TaxID=2719234 RepID=UPI0028AB11EF|nr:methyltransferase domain-containing protein [Lacrimispora sp.]